MARLQGEVSACPPFKVAKSENTVGEEKDGAL
jgi:hypothetical protein